jgi:hypothetical protein
MSITSFSELADLVGCEIKVHRVVGLDVMFNPDSVH